MPLLTFAALLGAVFAIVCSTLMVGEMLRRRRVGREVGSLITQDQCRYIILDVREENEFVKKHVAASRNIPFSRSGGCFPSENMFERIIVFGPTDRKARIISRRLDRTGYFNVTHFGAFRNWRGAVETGLDNAAPDGSKGPDTQENQGSRDGRDGREGDESPDEQHR